MELVAKLFHSRAGPTLQHIQRLLPLVQHNSGSLVTANFRGQLKEKQILEKVRQFTHACIITPFKDGDDIHTQGYIIFPQAPKLRNHPIVKEMTI